MAISQSATKGFLLYPTASPEELGGIVREQGVSIVALQPMGYARTAESIQAWIEAVADAEQVVVTDIQPEDGEAPIPGVSAARIAEGIGSRATYIPQVSLVTRALVLLQGNVAVVGVDLCERVQRDWDRERTRVGLIQHVAVAMGGDSAEREVSLHSGLAVSAALRQKGLRVTEIDFSKVLLEGADELKLFAGVDRPDVVFLALHGTHAEDGAIQGLLELLDIPYTGSDIQTSAIAMDKQLTKALVSIAGVPVPKGVKVGRGQSLSGIGFPAGKLIVKPNAQGSTVGLRFVDDPKDLADAIRFALHYDSHVLIEERIEGMEVSVPVLAGRALPVVEIVPASGRYDFESKYTPDATEEICPARLTDEMTAQLQDYAVRVHQLLGCRGATRSDFMVGPDGARFLEINTLPGLTPTSLLPRSAGVAGLTFVQLCEEILANI